MLRLTTRQKAMLLCFCVHSSVAVLVSTTVVHSIQTSAFHSLRSCLSAHCFPTNSVDHTNSILQTSSGHVSSLFMRPSSGAVMVSYRGHLIPQSPNCSRTKLPGLLCHVELQYVLHTFFHSYISNNFWAQELGISRSVAGRFHCRFQHLRQDLWHENGDQLDVIHAVAQLLFPCFDA